MSFNDAAVKGGSGRQGGPSSSNNNANISDLLQNFQRLSFVAKDRVVEMKRRKVSSAEKAELDALLKELRELDSKVKIQLDYQLKQLETLPRSGETAQRRIALDKLSKDCQKIKSNLQTIYTDAACIVVSDSGGGPRVVRGNDEDSRPAEPISANATRNQQMHVREPELKLIGESVDEAIALEREREIRQMNQDLLLVNEMMKDVANIVKEQGGMVETIHESTVQSHDKAKAGLDQVKQAAAHQTTCTVS